jgi:hypothetical protein
VRSDLRRRLERIPLPGETESAGRAWEVVREAYATRDPVSWPTRRAWPLALAAAALAVAAAALSSPGRAVLDSVRDAVLPERVVKSKAALFSLPAPGRLLVVSAEHGGVWVVRTDGSRRRLGDFEDAQWSPHGLFVVTARSNELSARTPGGTERWTLARPNVSAPRWSPSGYRIAYTSGSELRVVAGDGTGDRLLERLAGPYAWDPTRRHVLTYLFAGRVVQREVDTGRILWTAPAGGGLLRRLDWSPDGRRLLVATDHRVRLLDGDGRLVRAFGIRGLLLAAAFAPGRAHRIALHVRHEAPAADSDRARRSEVRVVDADVAGRSRQLVAGAGVFGELAWSPDGRWLLVDWRTADQWLFVRVGGAPKVVAVAGMSRQFPRRDGATPQLLVLDRWCC